jgi:hypothetical protein
MAGVKSIEKHSSLRATNLAHNDSIRPMAKSCLQWVGEANLALVSIKLGLSRDDVLLLYIEFGYILKIPWESGYTKNKSSGE